MTPAAPISMTARAVFTRGYVPGLETPTTIGSRPAARLMKRCATSIVSLSDSFWYSPITPRMVMPWEPQRM